jgi:hypothetical protein
LPNGGDRVFVETTLLHSEIENAVHDRSVVIDARR